MAMKDGLLPEFDHEMALARKVIERVAEDKLSWAPHEKSMTLGALASHLANIPSWIAPTIQSDSLDLAPVGGEPRHEPENVHHRAPLGVYLRLLDVPLPGLYGPSADELP